MSPTLTHESVFSTVRDLIQQVSVVPIDAITESSRLREDLALDSVASMELLSMLDEVLGLQLEMEDVLGVETVGGIVSVALARLTVRASA